MQDHFAFSVLGRKNKLRPTIAIFKKSSRLCNQDYVPIQETDHDIRILNLRHSSSNLLSPCDQNLISKVKV